MNILAVGAHPDDIELYAGGTLAKYAKRGDKVFMATATNGNVGSAVLTMDEIAAVRKREAKKSAELIGAEYICLDYDDEMFFEDKNARLAFINLVRYCKADIILTHNPTDYNPDHELTGKIIKDIAVMIPVGHIKTESPPNDCIPNIFYWEPVHGLGFCAAGICGHNGYVRSEKRDDGTASKPNTMDEGEFREFPRIFRRRFLL